MREQQWQGLIYTAELNSKQRPVHRNAAANTVQKLQIGRIPRCILATRQPAPTCFQGKSAKTLLDVAGNVDMKKEAAYDPRRKLVKAGNKSMCSTNFCLRPPCKLIPHLLYYLDSRASITMYLTLPHGSYAVIFYPPELESDDSLRLTLPF